MFNGIEAIKGERDSQLSRGFDQEHDSNYINDELLDAAVAHINAAAGDPTAHSVWPFGKDNFHLNTPVSSLAKAGALIAAEIDRRIAAGECKETDFGHPFPKE